MKPTYVIEGADERGVPLAIRCDQCGWYCERADDDPDGDLLPVHAHHHTKHVHTNHNKGT
jgi:hypothetical protein